MYTSDRVLLPEVADVAEAIAWRHLFHKHPELAYQEHKTADFIALKLTEFGLSVHRGLGGTGVIGSLVRGTGRRTIAIRADIDALPIQERSGVKYSSCVSGSMHACGHDGHVAMLLAAAQVCSRLSDLDGTVHFIFQPAEEGGAGARRMIEEGLFERFPTEAIFALHNWPALPLGTYVARNDTMMAANAVFEITVRGRGCHGAMPHEGTDSVLAACQLVSALQSVVSRSIDPLQSAVVSVTQVHAGSSHNVIPDTCILRGTARWLRGDVGDAIERRIGQLSTSITAGFGCEAIVRYERRYPITINHPEMAELVRAVANDLPLKLTHIEAQPSMGSEDFGFMLEAVPGCYFWLGAGKAHDNFGLHSPNYDFNDDVIAAGIAIWINLVRRRLWR